jgi:TusA-related sulfurtransferase
MILHEGQLLEVVKDHHVISVNNINAFLKRDLLLVVESVNAYQAVVVRISDGIKAYISTIDFSNNFMTDITYIEVNL